MRNNVIMLLVVVTVINLVYWLTRDAQEQQAARPAQATAQSAATTPAPTHTVRLLGIPVQIDSNGNLVTDTHIKQLFDLLASQNTEEPVDNWKHQILQPFAKKLPPAALASLQDAFDRYVEFNLALQLLPMEGAPNLSAVLQRVQTLRSHYLGPYADPMYADWGALEDFTHQYLTIMTQKRDVGAAHDKLEQLAEQLPGPVQGRAQDMIRHSTEDFAVDAMAALEPAEYSRMLQEQAAVTLIETTLLFDEPAPQFMRQYEQYNEQKREILLSDADSQTQQRQLETLRRQHFQGSDILRAETLDRAEAF